MVDWLAGKRVRGTSSERSGFGLSLGGTGVGGWVELGRYTAGSSISTLSVSSLPDKRYYMLLTYGSDSSGGGTSLRFNGDTGSNYGWRRSENGSTDSAFGNQTLIINDGGGTNPRFNIDYIANYSSKEKLTIHHMVNRSGAGTANVPGRAEVVGKWANTSNAINQITQNASGNWSSGDELVVLGYDPLDSHTNNFWEELDSVTLLSANASLDSNTFTAKKYLWIQLALIPNSTDSIGLDMQINSDTGTNYPFRRSTNGGADGTFTAFNEFTPYPNSGNYPIFVNMFWINNASNEKLGIAHSISGNTAGAGTAPERREDAMKWVNTSNQITSLQFGTNTAGQFGIGSTLKVWGAD